jgi:hypothetical protein
MRSATIRQQGGVAMLGLYSREAVARGRCTLVYRGYELEITREFSDWRVELHPKVADLPILGSIKFAAPIGTRARIDGMLAFLAYC